MHLQNADVEMKRTKTQTNWIHAVNYFSKLNLNFLFSMRVICAWWNPEIRLHLHTILSLLLFWLLFKTAKWKCKLKCLMFTPIITPNSQSTEIFTFLLPPTHAEVILSQKFICSILHFVWIFDSFAIWMLWLSAYFKP